MPYVRHYLVSVRLDPPLAAPPAGTPGPRRRAWRALRPVLDEVFARRALLGVDDGMRVPSACFAPARLRQVRLATLDNPVEGGLPYMICYYRPRRPAAGGAPARLKSITTPLCTQPAFIQDGVRRHLRRLLRRGVGFRSPR